MENDPLQQLKDVHLPADPGWWPPAIGWWLLAIILIAGLIWLLFKAYQAYQARKPIRAAKAELSGIYQAQTNSLEYATQANAILKRLLVHALGHHAEAPLSGEEWLAALDQHSNSTQFTDGAGRALGDARFTPTAQIDRDALHTAITHLMGQVRPTT